MNSKQHTVLEYVSLQEVWLVSDNIACLSLVIHSLNFGLFAGGSSCTTFCTGACLEAPQHSSALPFPVVCAPLSWQAILLAGYSVGNWLFCVVAIVSLQLLVSLNDSSVQPFVQGSRSFAGYNPLQCTVGVRRMKLTQ